MIAHCLLHSPKFAGFPGRANGCSGGCAVVAMCRKPHAILASAASVEQKIQADDDDGKGRENPAAGALGAPAKLPRSLGVLGGMALIVGA